ncbi:MAG: hypothetical protein NC926_02535 [Candidatus Omnitrophica bacterium]|nr:hypothetical protein [Candidatus Omnitrophota bacterium]MCM8806825.1 hypothetical protein [Candidatus Omnitrophota bacterium]
MKNKKIYENIKFFKKVNEKTYQLLGWLGFTKEETLKTETGIWEIYTNINKFCAILKNSKECVLYGNFENLNELKSHLNRISKIFFKKEKKFLGIPFTLTEENGQDYGYIRGLILGLFLITLDLSYSFIFKLKNGIITGFIEYVKIIYYGTPGFGLFVGITGTGLYFIFLLIIIPIIFGLYYRKKATNKILKEIDNFIDEVSPYGYEFGIEAEKAIEDEFYLTVEEKKKNQIYMELKNFVDIEKENFDLLYEKLKRGFLKIDELIKFLEDYQDIFKNFPLIEFLKIIQKYNTAKIETEIRFKIKPSQE